jgi:putative hydrolase of the HAD superfamily
MTLRHISCDLWGTLIISNKLFSSQRASHLQHNYFRSQTVQDIAEKIQEIGERADATNMQTGVSIPAEILYGELFDAFGVPYDTSTMSEVLGHAEELFLQYPPQLINEHILQDLHDCRKHVTLSIGSNTAFIKGESLVKVLKLLGIDRVFNFYVFSDEIGYSKPDQNFFEKIHGYLAPRQIEKQQVAHIGDNARADYHGAAAFGYRAAQVNFKINRLLDVCNILLTAPIK